MRWLLLLPLLMGASLTVPLPEGCIPVINGTTVTCAGPVTPPPVIPPVTQVPETIDGMQTKTVGPLTNGTRTTVGSLKSQVLVVRSGSAVQTVTLYEFGGAPLNRLYWVTTDPSGTPVWKRGGTGPTVTLSPGEYAVFKAQRDGEGTPSAVEAR